MSRKPTRSRDPDSRGAARGDSGSDGAVSDASVRGGIRIRGVLSSDEGRSKGENGEHGESEHGVVCKGRMELEGEC